MQVLRARHLCHRAGNRNAPLGTCAWPARTFLSLLNCVHALLAGIFPCSRAHYGLLCSKQVLVQLAEGHTLIGYEHFYISQRCGTSSGLTVYLGRCLPATRNVLMGSELGRCQAVLPS